MEKEFWSYFNYLIFDLPEVKEHDMDLIFYLRDRKTEYIKEIIVKDLNAGRAYVFDNLRTANERLNYIDYLRELNPGNRGLVSVQCDLNYFVDDLISVLFYYSPEDLKNEEIRHIARKHCTVQVYEIYFEGFLIDDEQPKNSITFDSPETLEKVFDSLKGYFPGKEKELSGVLNGEKATEPLYWPGDQKQFTEIFRRLKFNGKLLNQSTEIKDWLCFNFIYQFRRGAVKEQRPFNPSTIHDFLTKYKGDLARNKRVKTFDWLEYISHEQNLDDKK